MASRKIASATVTDMSDAMALDQINHTPIASSNSPPVASNSGFLFVTNGNGVMASSLLSVLAGASGIAGASAWGSGKLVFRMFSHSNTLAMIKPATAPMTPRASIMSGRLSA